MTITMKHWKNIAGFALIIAILVLQLDWLWGFLFLIWFAQGIFYGETFIIESVKREDGPIIFWSILLLWLAMAGYCFLAVLYPNY